MNKVLHERICIGIVSVGIFELFPVLILKFATLNYPDCPILSQSFSVDGVNELFIYIEAVTRTCSTVSNDINCTGKLILSLYYEMVGKGLEIFAFSDKIPKQKVKTKHSVYS